MKDKSFPQPRGQSLVLVALAMVVFLGILGLVLDGGYTFAMRRQAQNAADAGALAGVRMLCQPDPDNPNSPENQAIAAAGSYVGLNNVANAPGVSVNSVDRRVTVTTTIDVNTFFAHFVGVDEIPVQASATAGCFAPAYGRAVLPVAWSCKPPISGSLSDSEDCQQQRIDWDTLEDYLANPDDPPCVDGVCPELYIVMDSYTYEGDILCDEEGGLNDLTCDLDGDGEIDWLGSGGRSWIDLDGSEPIYDCDNAGEGSAELVTWISDGFPCELTINTWVPEVTGVSTNIFSSVEDRRRDDPLVTVPVYNDFCPDGNPNPDPGPVPVGCEDKWQTGDQDRPVPAAQPMFFRINAFSAFYITCVRLNQGDHCPGADRIGDLNVGISMSVGEFTSMKSVEGYFLEGYIPGVGGRLEDGVDTGVYTFYLSR